VGHQAGTAKRTHSFGRALFQILVLGILLPTGLIWAVGQVTTRAAISFLWEGLSDEIAQHSVESTLRYLETGNTALEYNASAVSLKLVDPADRRGMLDYLTAGLQANPNVTWYSFAGEDGAYLSAFRRPEGGVKLTWREQEDGNARYRDFLVEADGSWTTLPEVVKPYDPRTRGWYQATLAADGVVWSKPFLFASGPPGFILSTKAFGPGGETIGAWGIEYEMAYVSRFLASLEIGQHGRAYLVTADGDVLGHPLVGERIGEADGWIVVQQEVDGQKKKVIANAEKHRDAWLQRAFAETCCTGTVQRNAEFEIDGEAYLCAATSFPAVSGLDWTVLVVVPEEDILGTVHRRSLWTGIAAALIASLFLFLGYWTARRRLSGPLADVAYDLELMARFETDVQPRVKSSPISEVQGMVRARETMRGGLRSFEKYVPADLVRELMRSGKEAKLGGEERELTVMFSDVAGFTRITEALGEPRLLVEALSHYLGAMSAEIARTGGTVDKYVGDAIMSFWGAPNEHPTHALAACEAALKSQELLRELRGEWRAAGKPEFSARIGVNTGVMLVGNLGSAARMNYTVMGDAVNLGSRLEGLCSIYGLEIAVGEETYAAVKDHFACRPVDYVEVKGREQAVVFYELLGRQDEVDDARREAARLYAAALDRYLAREFTEARKGFQQVLKLRPDDVAAQELIERCELYEIAEPGPDWTGAMRMSRKK